MVIGPATDMAQVRAVFFDVGETLVDESAEYGRWADWLGVPRHTFWAVFGAVLSRGEDHRQVFQRFRPGLDLQAEHRKRHDAGVGESYHGRDLYPDARPALQALKDAGLFVGVAGNQAASVGHFIRELNLPVDLVTTSGELGAVKPDPAFFERLCELSGFEPSETLHVGDRLDNDVRPAKQLGMRTAFVRRGPWALCWPLTPQDVGPDLIVDSLLELAPALAGSRSPWPADQLERIGAAVELEIAVARPDRSLRRWLPIWVVRVGDQAYVRTAYRRRTGWFADVLESRRARIRVPGLEADVVVEDLGASPTEASERLWDDVDLAYRSKYGHGATTDLMTQQARRATLRLHPAPPPVDADKEEPERPDRRNGVNG